MRVLFILKESVMHERMGVMYLSAALKSRGYDIKLVLADRLGIKNLMRLVNDYVPDVIGYSAMTGEHLNLLGVNSLLKKEFKFLSVFGGPHPTFFPNMIHEEGVDAICIGEGEMAFPEFCKRIDEKGPFWETPNFWVRQDGEIVRNALLPLVKDLDTLPFPDRDLMYESDPALYDESHKMFITTRGCPYRCTYCYNNNYNEIYRGKGQVLRYRSPENVIDEIYATIRQYPLDVVLIEDDTFVPKPKEWLERFSRLYKNRINLPLSINARANFVTEETISLLKGAGLDSVWMGIECGNQDIANTVLERNLTNEQIIKASNILKDYGIKLATQNLIGLPVSNSYRIDFETLDLNIKIKPTYAWSSILYPYPGTPIESYARSRGFLGDEIPFLSTNKRSTVFNFSKEEKRKIENLHKLFGFIVQFPFLRRFTDFLCSLPLERLYVALFYFLYGYNMKFRLYPFHSIRKEIGNYMRLWWKFVQKN